MTAAPRCCTVGMKLSLNQLASTTDSAGLPSTVAWCRSGYWVAEWFPQMTTFFTFAKEAPLFSVSCANPRLWSNRVIAVNRCGGSEGALRCAIRELVLAGLPTTRTRTSRLATASRALPWAEKILAFSSSRSLRSMPGPRGRAPTSMAKSQSLKATAASLVAVTLLRAAKAQSFNSITTP